MTTTIENCDYQVDATKDQIAELESETRALTIAWLDRHNVMPRVYTVEHAQSHLVIGHDEDGLVFDGEALPGQPLSDPSETVASHARTPASSSSSSSSPGCD